MAEKICILQSNLSFRLLCYEKKNVQDFSQYFPMPRMMLEAYATNFIILLETLFSNGMK